MVLKRESELGDCAGSSDPRQREIVSEIAAPLESRQIPSCTRRNGVDQSANGSKVELADMPPRYQTNNRGCRRHGGGTVDTEWPSHGRDLADGGAMMYVQRATEWSTGFSRFDRNCETG